MNQPYKLEQEIAVFIIIFLIYFMACALFKSAVGILVGSIAMVVSGYAWKKVRDHRLLARARNPPTRHVSPGRVKCTSCDLEFDLAAGMKFCPECGKSIT